VQGNRVQGIGYRVSSIKYPVSDFTVIHILYTPIYIFLILPVDGEPEIISG